MIRGPTRHASFPTHYLAGPIFKGEVRNSESETKKKNSEFKILIKLAILRPGFIHFSFHFFRSLSMESVLNFKLHIYVGTMAGRACSTRLTYACAVM